MKNWFLFISIYLLAALSSASAAKVTAPASTNMVIKLAWIPISHALKYEVWSSTNIAVPFILYTNVGLATNATFTYPKVSADAQRYYYVKGYFWQGGSTNLARVTLTWDYACGKITNIARYKIYYGSSPLTYTNVFTVPYCTNRTEIVSNLLRGTTYFFALTAIDNNGLESDYSSEASTSTTPIIVITNAVRVPVFFSVTR